MGIQNDPNAKRVVSTSVPASAPGEVATPPATTPPSSTPPPARDVRRDAAQLNQIAPRSTNIFRPGSILARGEAKSVGSGLPGGSVSAALSRAEEFGDIADAAAARVAANHPEIFGA